LHYSLQISEKDTNVRELDVFAEPESTSVDRCLSPTVIFEHQMRKNTPHQCIINSLSPSIRLFNTNKMLVKDREKYRKVNAANFYRAFVENRKKTESQLHKSKPVEANLSNSRTRSNIEVTAVKPEESEVARIPINRVDMNLAYRHGFESVKLTQKVDVKFPWMKRITKLRVEQSV
jgi:hypothetical protein